MYVSLHDHGKSVFSVNRLLSCRVVELDVVPVVIPLALGKKRVDLREQRLLDGLVQVVGNIFLHRACQQVEHLCQCE